MIYFYNLYFVDNKGVIHLEKKAKDIKTILKEIEKNYKVYLDTDTDRHIIITTKEIKR